MTKKTWVLAALLLLAAAVWGQETRYIDGRYYGVEIIYGGKNKGQEDYNRLSSLPNYTGRTDFKLTKEQWRAVNDLLNRYTSVRGDTYGVLIYNDNNIYVIVCEYTSATEYVYWIFWAQRR
jgi:hypothetical protein